MMSALYGTISGGDKLRGARALNGAGGVLAGDCACAVYFQSADRMAQLNDLEKNYGGGAMETLSSIRNANKVQAARIS